MTQRYDVQDLSAFAKDLFRAGGLDAPSAEIVANTLVEGDLLGFSTHGLQLLPLYLQALANGDMASNGQPAILADRGHAMTWDANWLPGPIVVNEALNAAYARMDRNATVTVAIRKSSHIGCLATYTQAAAHRGYLLLLTCSDPSVASVAPHGAVQGRMTPNPISAGWPTKKNPIVIDVCPSTTTNGMVNRYVKAGERCPGKWLIDSDGVATDDPNALTNGGAIMPVGGIELGHKGYALGLLVEALTGLSGAGRSNTATRWGASIFMILINPAMFGGADDFKREAQWLADSCRSAKPWPGGRVRVPGDRCHSAREDALNNGVSLHAQTVSGLAAWAKRTGIAMPEPKTTAPSVKTGEHLLPELAESTE